MPDSTEVFAMDKTGQRYGPGELVAVAIRNPGEISGASILFATVLEILMHDEDGMPYMHASHHDPVVRTITPYEGGFAVLAKPEAESYNSGSFLTEGAQPRVFTRVNNILALPGRTVSDLLLNAYWLTS